MFQQIVPEVSTPRLILSTIENTGQQGNLAQKNSAQMKQQPNTSDSKKKPGLFSSRKSLKKSGNKRDVRRRRERNRKVG